MTPKSHTFKNVWMSTHHFSLNVCMVLFPYSSFHMHLGGALIQRDVKRIQAYIYFMCLYDSDATQTRKDNNKRCAAKYEKQLAWTMSSFVRVRVSFKINEIFREWNSWPNLFTREGHLRILRSVFDMLCFQKPLEELHRKAILYIPYYSKEMNKQNTPVCKDVNLILQGLACKEFLIDWEADWIWIRKQWEVKLNL